MAHLSMLVVTTDGELLTCGGFSLGETIRFGSPEFFIDYFMGMARNGSPSLHTILEDTADEFYMTCSGEGSSDFPISLRHRMGTPPSPLATTLWTEDASTPQTMAMDPPWTITPQPDTRIPPNRWHPFRDRQRA
jgi:hypothetical protein